MNRLDGQSEVIAFVEKSFVSCVDVAACSASQPGLADSVRCVCGASPRDG